MRRASSTGCGQLLEILKWRDRCHHESEATVDNKSTAWLGDGNSWRDKAKWQGYHASVAALCRNNHGDTTAEQSRCGNRVTVPDCLALDRRGGDSWLGGMKWQDARLDEERGGNAAWKYRDE